MRFASPGPSIARTPLVGLLLRCLHRYRALLNRVVKTFDWWLQHALGEDGEALNGSEETGDDTHKGDDLDVDVERETVEVHTRTRKRHRGSPSKGDDRPAPYNAEDTPPQFTGGSTIDTHPEWSPSEEQSDPSRRQYQQTVLEQTPHQSEQRPFVERSRRSDGVGWGRSSAVGENVEEQRSDKTVRKAGEELSGSGGKPHYYLKFSSTREKSNRFVDRSLPFFVPSPPRYRFGLVLLDGRREASPGVRLFSVACSSPSSACGPWVPV